MCGDGIVNPHAGEQCDDGNTSDTDSCTALCQLARCGDGIVNTSAGEQCDDNNTSNTDGCTASCQLARCGDGHVQAGVENCEPGSHPACNANCQWNWCGDGIVNTSQEEVCDDGNQDSCGTCNSTCKKNQDVSRATGRIIGVPAYNINNGDAPETFTLRGSQGARVFEFDKDDAVEDGRVQVFIGGRIEESDAVAQAIEWAISEQYNDGKVDFRVSSRDWNIVMLEYRTAGRIADGIRISETVTVPGFRAEVLTRGFGYDCSTGMGCRRDEDCQSKSCTIPAGQVTGTCE
jgi:cysteine-rich repeat protein